MDFDLVAALEHRLREHHPSPTLDHRHLASLKVSALAVSYPITSSLPSALFRSLLRVRSRNQTEIPQRHTISAHVPESFTVNLVEVHWPNPVEVELPPPPRLERLALRAHAGTEASRKSRRVLRAQLLVPADTEILSELSYRPLALQGTIQGQIRVQGMLPLQTPGGNVTRLLDERFAVELGQWSALGVDEVLLEDRDAVRLRPVGAPKES